jgi:hypothetical protein
MECFYLNVKGDKELNAQYSDTAATYLADSDYKRRVRLNITTRNGRFYASSPDKLDVYREVIRIGGY